MDKITLKAYGKINLGLDILKKREDGYHELDMIMQTVGVYDTVTISRNNSNEIKVFADDEVLGDGKDNLAYKACSVLFKKFNINEGVDISITKRIPIAGGMAGGSADCAATLKGVNELFNLNLSKNELCEIGIKLGADVPYCILGNTKRAKGIGEKLTSLPKPPSAYLLIAKPPIYVSTAYVYGNIKVDKINKHPDMNGIESAIIDGDLKRMSNLLYNVMEEVTTKDYPEITNIKNIMIKNGAINSIMSGSGPTVFGIFDNIKKAENAKKYIENNHLALQIYLTDFVNC